MHQHGVKYAPDATLYTSDAHMTLAGKSEHTSQVSLHRLHICITLVKNIVNGVYRDTLDEIHCILKLEDKDAIMHRHKICIKVYTILSILPLTKDNGAKRTCRMPDADIFLNSKRRTIYLHADADNLPLTGLCLLPSQISTSHKLSSHGFFTAVTGEILVPLQEAFRWKPYPSDHSPASCVSSFSCSVRKNQT